MGHANAWLTMSEEDDRPMSTRGVVQFPITVSVPISEADKRKLDAMCLKIGTTRAQLVRRFIHEGLKAAK
jgi:hypothetical protein